jgi:hypothetical protein
MIASVEGVVGAIAADSLVLEVGGIGYRVFAAPAILATATPDASSSTPSIVGRSVSCGISTDFTTLAASPGGWATAAQDSSISPVNETKGDLKIATTPGETFERLPRRGTPRRARTRGRIA